ncbi:MAG: GNAT family N-acetyltransferase [bacterium]|nr:GNAT family N-acetyltransferase [bacterium]
MKIERLQLRELSIKEIDQIKSFFTNVFTNEPWNDDWSDGEQLHSYIMDLIGNRNSLVLALFEEEQMVGLTMGNIKHWYTGTEYYIDELCIKREEQGKGLGTQFLRVIEEYLVSKGVSQIFLQTERTMPAYEFYKKNGFCELNDHVSFYKECNNGSKSVSITEKGEEVIG